MRIRSLKPGFWISEDIARLDEAVALHYIGLWSYAQDNGVGRDDPRLLKAALYPLRAKVTISEVARRQRVLVLARLIVRYQDNGVALFYIPAWDSHQRVANPARCQYGRPTVPVTSLYGDTREEERSPSAVSTETLGIGVRSGEGEGEVGMELGCRSLEVGVEDDSLRSLFERAWRLYPKRPDNSKGKAFRAWKARVRQGVDILVMEQGTQRYAAYVAAEGTDPKFIKQAATFFGPDEHYLSTYEVPSQKITVYDERGEFTPEFLRANATAEREAARR